MTIWLVTSDLINPPLFVPFSSKKKAETFVLEMINHPRFEHFNKSAYKFDEKGLGNYTIDDCWIQIINIGNVNLIKNIQDYIGKKEHEN